MVFKKIANDIAASKDTLDCYKEFLTPVIAFLEALRKMLDLRCVLFRNLFSHP